MRRSVAVVLRRGWCRPDTGPVIGAAFGVTLARAQAGDEAAFACIFRDVQPALLRYLQVIAPEAEDVAGGTWVWGAGGPAGLPGRGRGVPAGPSPHRPRPVAWLGSLPGGGRGGGRSGRWWAVSSAGPPPPRGGRGGGRAGAVWRGAGAGRPHRGGRAGGGAPRGGSARLASPARISSAASG